MSEGLHRSDDLSERRYPPTPLRLEEARRRGLVARSADLAAVVALAGAMTALAVMLPEVGRRSLAAVRLLLDGRANPAGSPQALAEQAGGALGPLALAAGGLLGSIFVAAALAGAVQGGAGLRPERLAPDWARLGLGAGLRQMVGRRAAVRAAMALAKIVGVWLAAGWALYGMMPDVVGFAALPPSQMASGAARLAWAIALRAGAVLAALAALDYLYQRWEHRQGLMMTRREYLEDLSRMEGSPLARRRRKEILLRGSRPGVRTSPTEGNNAPGVSAGGLPLTEGASPLPQAARAVRQTVRPARTNLTAR